MRRIDLFIIPLIAFLMIFAVLIFFYEPLQATPPESGRSELVLAMSQFEVTIDESGREVYKAGDAQLWVVHPDEGWRAEVLMNPDSNVAHQGSIGDLDGDGLNELYVAGGQNATLKVYKKVNDTWEEEMLWRPAFIRVRGVEIGDVDGDGLSELVAGTHKDGVVVVIDREGNSWKITEVDRTPETYIHKMEICDVDGDGLNEFFSTPTRPNLRQGMPNSGSVTMYRWNGSAYECTLVEDFNDTCVKEIAAGDLDNDGRNELVAVLGGIASETNESSQAIVEGLIEVELEIPLRLKLYDFRGGSITSEIIAEINDLMARSLRIGDADNDGLNELIVGTQNRGLQIVRHQNGAWKREVIDSSLTGNIHEIMIIDIDNDGMNEVVANSDTLGIVNVYEWTGHGWTSQTVLDGLEGYLVWAMDFGDVDNE